jgi:hypothetical protein
MSDESLAQSSAGAFGYRILRYAQDDTLSVNRKLLFLALPRDPENVPSTAVVGDAG